MSTSFDFKPAHPKRIQWHAYVNFYFFLNRLFFPCINCCDD